MTRIRRFLLALLLLPAVVLGCLLVFVSLLDPNQYKPELIEAVRLQTGRQLTLGGPVEIAWWPQIRVRASTLTIGNAAGFAPADMIEIKELELAVDTLPLLSGRITMDTARVHGLKARLARNAEGQTNWNDLVAQRASAPFSRWSGLGVVALGGEDFKNLTPLLGETEFGAEREAAFRQPIVDVHLDLGLGAGSDEFISCGLTKAYVELNADYTT